MKAVAEGVSAAAVRVEITEIVAGFESDDDQLRRQIQEV